MAILVNEETRIIVQGITGREAANFVRDGLDYGAKIVAGVTPGRGGRDVHGVPVYDTVRQAVAQGPVDASVLAVPAPFVRDAAFEALDAGVPLLVILTERVPRRDVVQVLELARLRGARVIGPNSMGLIAPGKTKVGSVGGPAADAAKSFQPGPVGIMSRSGGMTTEIASLLLQHGLGQSTAVSMGGDPIIGSTFVDLLPLWEADPETRALVIFSEPGGRMELALAEEVRRRGSRLPVVAFIAGAFADEMPGVRFGHAGSIVEGRADTVAEKRRALREAGILVAEHLSEVPGLVRQALGQAVT
ncbi:MAG TPA: CoA-binding protein [Dehalococcoidia bacterium]